MKVLGLLGGMSWESTAEYYRLANEETRLRLGGLHSAPMLLWSADFAEIEELQASGRWEEAGTRLAGAAEALERAGAELLVLCTNTMHKVADVIESSVRIPLVHIVDSVAAAVAEAGMKRVGLLGTRFTMEEPFWADRMGRRGIAVVVPGMGDRSFVHRIILDELCLGVFSDPSRAKFVETWRRWPPKAPMESSSAVPKSSYSSARRTRRSPFFPPPLSMSEVRLRPPCVGDAA